jgi:uncharacterized membrane protein
METAEMTRNKATVNTLRFLQIIVLDVVVSLFVGLLVYERASRWPILLVIVPLLLFFNIKQIRRMQESSQRVSIALPLVYGTGLVYALLWTIFSFEWWKLLIVPIPLFLMIYFLQRSKHAPRDDVAEQRE